MTDLRKEKEQEITEQLAEMVEESRTILINEISFILNDDDIDFSAIEKVINKDCDNKLQQIPDTVKTLFDNADENAETISLEVLKKSLVNP